VNNTLAVVQAGGWARTPREAMFLVLSSLQQELTKPQALRKELQERRQAPRRALLMELVDEYSSGVSSLNEREFARICRKHGLPEPIRQSRRKDSKGRDRYIDAEFQAHDGRIIMVEIDGMQHLDPENWTEDIERQNSLMVRTGGLVLRVSTFMLRHNPESFVSDMQEAISGTSDADGQLVTSSDQSPAA
jgi:very-short-patch-repair endonuclease